jgi:glutathione S-transferase
MILYDNPVSSNALKVRFLAAELGVELERREVSMARPRPDWYVALNPLGGIPALQDGDFVLAESQAILRFLAAREGRADLYPTEHAERAKVDEFLDRFTTRLRPPLFGHEALALGYEPAVGFVAAARDMEGAARVEGELRPHLDLIESVVGEGGAVLGRFTIADCALAPVLFRTTKTGLSLDAHPKLAALRDALLARPAWAAADPVL